MSNWIFFLFPIKLAQPHPTCQENKKNKVSLTESSDKLFLWYVTTSDRFPCWNWGRLIVCNFAFPSEVRSYTQVPWGKSIGGDLNLQITSFVSKAKANKMPSTLDHRLYLWFTGWKALAVAFSCTLCVYIMNSREPADTEFWKLKN
jgi:hypothetical protein